MLIRKQKGQQQNQLSHFSCIIHPIVLDTHARASTCERTTSALPTWFCLGGRTSLGLIVSWSYYAVHLWRSHYKIHKLFRHVRTLLNLAWHHLVHHSHARSPSVLTKEINYCQLANCSPTVGEKGKGRSASV